MDTIKKWIYEENSDKMRQEARILGSILMVLIFVPPLHFIGTYITYGFVIANNPGFDLSTGCEIGKPNCFQKMLCYEGNLGSCHALSILTMWLVPLIVLILYLFVMFCYRKYLQWRGTKSVQPNDIETGTKSIQPKDIETGTK